MNARIPLVDSPYRSLKYRHYHNCGNSSNFKVRDLYHRVEAHAEIHLVSKGPLYLSLMNEGTEMLERTKAALAERHKLQIVVLEKMLFILNTINEMRDPD